MYFIVIDANVWIKYARAKNIAPLLDRFISYDFVPVINNYLLSEVFDALVGKKWMHENDALHSSNKIYSENILFHYREGHLQIKPGPEGQLLNRSGRSK